MATFLDIINKALERVDEDTSNPDTQGLSVIKEGINQGYMILKSTLDENALLKVVPYSKEIKLSADTIRVMQLRHEYIGYINKNEYKKEGDMLFIHNTDLEEDEGELTLIYSAYPTKLSANTDIINLKDGLLDALTAYAGYRYMLSKRKYSSAQLLLEEFKSYYGANPPTNIQ